MQSEGGRICTRVPMPLLQCVKNELSSGQVSGSSYGEQMPGQFNTEQYLSMILYIPKIMYKYKLTRYPFILAKD